MPSVWCDVNGLCQAKKKGHGVLKLRCHSDVGDSLATDVPMSSAVPLQLS